MSANQHQPHPHAFTDVVSRSTASTNRRQVFHQPPYHVSPTSLDFCLRVRIFTDDGLILVASYLGAEFKEVIENPIIEYKQANLTVKCAWSSTPFYRHNSRFYQRSAIVTTAFDPPEGQEPYSYVFDLSGEIRWDRPEQV